MSKRRERKSKSDQFKEGCISLFENSFLDNYESWNVIMSDVNSILSSISKEIPLYQYDEFCIEAKRKVYNIIMSDGWMGNMISIGGAEKLNSSTLFHSKKYEKTFKNLEGSLEEIEQKLLTHVFIESVSSRMDHERFQEKRTLVMGELEELIKKARLSWI
jgi:hypothetical protein